MNQNYLRYKNMDYGQYEKKTLLSRFIGKESYATISRILNRIRNKKVLELGCGTGRFTELYYKSNNVICIDINPHLMKLGGIKVVKGNVRNMNAYVQGDNFDLILSFFLTEYLSPEDLKKTFDQCSNSLKNDGYIIFTFISKGLWGLMYIYGARFFKDTMKYSYDLNFLYDMADNYGMKIKHVHIIKKFGISFAYMIKFKKIGY